MRTLVFLRCEFNFTSFLSRDSSRSTRNVFKVCSNGSLKRLENRDFYMVLLG